MKSMIVLTGPTAVGKTSLSLRLARAVDAEIVSADSMQVYRHMDIGTAKLPPRQRQGIPHHLIDCADPDESYDVVRYQHEAGEALTGIYDRGRIPLVTGGTGFYIQALTRDIDFTETGSDPSYRARLEQQAASGGADLLFEELRRVDPESARTIHPHNIQRVIRALEYYRAAGEKISEHNRRERERSSPYRLLYLVLNCPRPELYRRIDRRTDSMMAQGFVEEVEALRAQGFSRSLPSMQGLGYREIFTFLEGEISREEAIDQIKRNTRHYAKRQLTWFRREPDAVWLNREDYPSQEALSAHILSLCRERGLISGEKSFLR